MINSFLSYYCYLLGQNVILMCNIIYCNINTRTDKIIKHHTVNTSAQTNQKA